MQRFEDLKVDIPRIVEALELHPRLIGKELVCYCPFHSERDSPNLEINSETGLWHCVSGETLVQTQQGLTKAKDLFGKIVKVLSKDGVYRRSSWHDFGIRQLWAVVLDNGEIIHATDKHRWPVVASGYANPRKDLEFQWCVTYNLEGKRLLVQPAAGFVYDEDEYKEGVRHGITYGDGSIYYWRQYSILAQYGDENIGLLYRFFKDYKLVERYGRAAVQTIQAIRLPVHWKELPGNVSSSYKRGFIAGIIAADGYVRKKGNVVLHQSSIERLEGIRKIAESVGLPVASIKLQRSISPFDNSDKPLWEMTFVRGGFYYSGGVDRHLIIKASHRRNFMNVITRYRKPMTRQVVEVYPTNRYENVYCCIEPETSTWVTGSGILTGNCWVCTQRGNMVQLVMQLRSESYRGAIGLLEEYGGVPTIAEIRERNLRELQTILTPIASARFVEVDVSKYRYGRSWWKYVRGYDVATIGKFSLGFDSVTRRAVIPIGFMGKWVGICKRATQDNQLQKYLYNKEFPKDRVLFGWDLVPHQENECILVEGPTDTMRGHGFGYPNTLGLMGTAVTDGQLRLITNRFDSVVLMMDNDPAGAIATLRNAERLAKHVNRVFIAPFDEVIRKDPDELSVNEWWQVLQGKRHWTALFS